ncbi:MAG: hypothetical protein K8T91_06665 [Planctomycetes bacterium]|nr:hypothetical protein [Planctomycetota bacterium]
MEIVMENVGVTGFELGSQKLPTAGKWLFLSPTFFAFFKTFQYFFPPKIHHWPTSES